MNARPLIDVISQELQRDSVFDDVTAQLLGREGSRPCTAWVRTRKPGIFAGEAVVGAFQMVLPPHLSIQKRAADGAEVEPGSTLAQIQGPVAQVLSMERTLVNFLSHACGVATLTREFVKAVEPLPVRILATRKTLPGLRDLQLQAVVAGGGHVHRRSLADGILIKDNHQVALSGEEILERAQFFRSPLHGIEIEVQNFEQLAAALRHAPDIIMLDNFSPEDAKRAISIIGNQARIEISGGINLETIRQYAELRPDYISVGQITHSAPALDLTLDLECKR